MCPLGGAVWQWSDAVNLWDVYFGSWKCVCPVCSLRLPEDRIGTCRERRAFLITHTTVSHCGLTLYICTVNRDWERFAIKTCNMLHCRNNSRERLLRFTAWHMNMTFRWKAIIQRDLKPSFETKPPLNVSIHHGESLIVPVSRFLSPSYKYLSFRSVQPVRWHETEYCAFPKITFPGESQIACNVCQMHGWFDVQNEQICHLCSDKWCKTLGRNLWQLAGSGLMQRCLLHAATSRCFLKNAQSNYSDQCAKDIISKLAVKNTIKAVERKKKNCSYEGLYK